MRSTKTYTKPNGDQRRNQARRTPEEALAFAEHIEELRRWLKSLTEKELEKAISMLTLEELFYVNWFNTYDSYQEGGALREIVEGTV